MIKLKINGTFTWTLAEEKEIATGGGNSQPDEKPSNMADGEHDPRSSDNKEHGEHEPPFSDGTQPPKKPDSEDDDEKGDDGSTSNNSRRVDIILSMISVLIFIIIG